jgi:cytochrome c-type biogenesis protein CcmE
VVEVKGEVDQKERSQMMRPGVVKPDPKEFLYIPVFRLRLLTASGKLVQVLYKGELPGDADIGEQVVVKGIDKGGVIHARSIYNLSTNSWVTPPPGILEKIFGDWF